LSVRRAYFVYILASRSRNLYTGVTNDVARRVVEHRHGLIDGFTREYRIHRLVYFESFGDIRAAIAREKQIKSWRRDKKVALINRENPTWEDLAAGWYRNEKADPSGRCIVPRDDSKGERLAQADGRDVKRG
jgi:putative endonuclease